MKAASPLLFCLVTVLGLVLGSILHKANELKAVIYCEDGKVHTRGLQLQDSPNFTIGSISDAEIKRIYNDFQRLFCDPQRMPST